MFSLRTATYADYDFLFSLHRAAMRDYVESIWGWHEDWQAEYFRKKFNPLSWQVIVIDGNDAGVLIVEERPDEIYLGLIELLPEYQGRGVGTEIINRLKAKARSQNLPLTLHVLRTNASARRLYERLGFRLKTEEENRYEFVWTPNESGSNFRSPE